MHLAGDILFNQSDCFVCLAGKIADNTTGNVACDMYHRWQSDIALMQKLGIKHYRSVAVQAAS